MPWSYNFFSRFSQHAVHSNQTLGDLFEVIPCPSNKQPPERWEGDKLVGYGTSDDDNPLRSTGCVMCIEDVAYGDGMSEVDYAE